jgi:hypothetical protein
MPSPSSSVIKSGRRGELVLAAFWYPVHAGCGFTPAGLQAGRDFTMSSSSKR